MAERVHIHRVAVRGAGDTAAFEAALPCPLAHVTGIAFIAMPAPAHMAATAQAGWRIASAGTIAFRHPAPGDTFLAAPVPLALPVEQGFAPLGVPHPAGKAMGGGEPWIGGGHVLQWHPASPGGEGRALKGLYRDQLNGLTGQDAPYTVDVFIRHRA
jgi:hypothetical protein